MTPPWVRDEGQKGSRGLWGEPWEEQRGWECGNLLTRVCRCVHGEEGSPGSWQVWRKDLGVTVSELGVVERGQKESPSGTGGRGNGVFIGGRILS